MNNFFIDTSSFQGVVQFNSPAGEFRAEYKGNKIWHIYEKSGSAFIMCCIARLHKGASCESIYKAYIDADD